MSKEFIINNNIVLKLENGKTNIYIKGNLFRQCKFLLINIPLDNPEINDNIKSIDDAADTLDTSLERLSPEKYNISPEEEFWAHCSNLQVWYENEYDTRLLHSNLSFALLKKLYDIGDPLVRKKYKEEVTHRFLFGSGHIQDFLIEEGFLTVVSREELLSSVKNSDILFKLEQLFNIQMMANTQISRGFLIEKGVITGLSLDDCKIKILPEIIKDLKSLRRLYLTRNSLTSLPEWITNFEHLEYLSVSYNQLEKIPESIGNLRNLRRLELQHNKIELIPDSVGRNNLIKVIPESIGKLTSVKDLGLGDNLFSILPESIGNLSSLGSLDISNNPILRIPNSITNLRNLRSIFLIGINKDLSGLIKILKRENVSIII
ncbi:hypothetical protein LCGC14_1885010 [marine sediment metagenome]|uniref:Leucine-rich repeat domain-containing protein n=1 Tax=marine sediment metagenome TaxID=412755 RepID=A0A0F9IZG0_9ZZZZ